MGRPIRHPRPDYVLNFEKPPHTEIKFISGHWYLYEIKIKHSHAGFLGIWLEATFDKNCFDESKATPYGHENEYCFLKSKACLELGTIFDRVRRQTSLKT